MAVSKGEFARRATALLRRKLSEAGVPLADFAVSFEEVVRLLEEPAPAPATVPAPEPPASGLPDRASADALAVWGDWLSMRNLPVQDIDAKSLGKIEERLAFGFTPQQLVECCRRVLADPALVDRTAVRAISKPLQSDQRVCQVLGIEYERPKRVTWLTPFEEIWKRHYPAGSLPEYGAMGKYLAPLVRRHGSPDVEREVERYLAETPSAFVSWPKFATTYGTASRTGKSRSYAGDAVEGLS